MAASRSNNAAPAPNCKNCFFGCRNLCALGLDEPCPTFRPDDPGGLVPPHQPSLLPRDPADNAVAEREPAAA